MIKWLPKREGMAYSQLYLFFEDRPFSLENARYILAEKSYAEIRKILSNLVQFGWAERPIRGKYRLRPIWKILKLVVFTHPLKHPLEVIESFGNKHAYVISGITAILFYNRSLDKPEGIYEIKVLPEDLDKWRKEFRRFCIPEKGSLPFIRGIKYVVMLRYASYEELKDFKEINGFRVESKEKAVIRCLKSGFWREGILSLIVNRNKLEYKKLIKQSIKNGLIKVIGALMEIINKEVGKELFSKELINYLYKESRKYKYKVEFSVRNSNKHEVFMPEDYGKILSKWDVRGIIDTIELRKIISSSM
jgi:hypothetical protein